MSDGVLGPDDEESGQRTASTISTASGYVDTDLNFGQRWGDLGRKLLYIFTSLEQSV